MMDIQTCCQIDPLLIRLLTDTGFDELLTYIQRQLITQLCLDDMQHHIDG